MSGEQDRTTNVATTGGWYCARCQAVHGQFMACPAAPPVALTWPPTGVGCICPPGANIQCENPHCPRKPARAPTAIGAVNP